MKIGNCWKDILLLYNLDPLNYLKGNGALLAFVPVRIVPKPKQRRSVMKSL